MTNDNDSDLNKPLESEFFENDWLDILKMRKRLEQN